MTRCVSTMSSSARPSSSTPQAAALMSSTWASTTSLLCWKTVRCTPHPHLTPTPPHPTSSHPSLKAQLLKTSKTTEFCEDTRLPQTATLLADYLYYKHHYFLASCCGLHAECLRTEQVRVQGYPKPQRHRLGWVWHGLRWVWHGLGWVRHGLGWVWHGLGWVWHWLG